MPVLNLRVFAAAQAVAALHADAIAAVRAAHPRHGGSGALYIVLKRARSSRKS